MSLALIAAAAAPFFVQEKTVSENKMRWKSQGLRDGHGRAGRMVVYLPFVFFSRSRLHSHRNLFPCLAAAKQR